MSNSNWADSAVVKEAPKLEEYCFYCKQLEENHCVFTPINRPNGCVCDSRDWSRLNLPPVCEQYLEELGIPDSNCDRCEHDRACHKK